jgi:hypothetical protein
LKKKIVAKEKKEVFRQKNACSALKIKDLERNRRIALEKLSLQLLFVTQPDKEDNLIYKLREYEMRCSNKKISYFPARWI